MSATWFNSHPVGENYWGKGAYEVDRLQIPMEIVTVLLKRYSGQQRTKIQLGCRFAGRGKEAGICKRLVYSWFSRIGGKTRFLKKRNERGDDRQQNRNEKGS